AEVDDAHVPRQVVHDVGRAPVAAEDHAPRVHPGRPEADEPRHGRVGDVDAHEHVAAAQGQVGEAAVAREGHGRGRVDRCGEERIVELEAHGGAGAGAFDTRARAV